MDYKLATWGHSTWKYPHILGLDVVLPKSNRRIDFYQSGEVVSCGSGVPVCKFKPGDRVVYHGDLSRPGGYAEYSSVTWRALTHIPANVSNEDAAALPCAGLTAYQALHRRLHVKAGDSILIHGGAGGVGLFAVQLAALAGCSPVITTCSEKNNDFVRSLGATHIVNYEKQSVVDEVAKITGGRG